MTTKLYIEKIGQGNPLVLLHGWGWHSGVWQPLVETLTEKYQLFIIDLPGFGKSPLLPKHYELETLSQALLEVTPANAAWLGWSLGGMLAWYIAIHHPARVSHLVTVATSPKFIAKDAWPGVSLATLETFTTALKKNSQATLNDFLELQLRGSHQKNQLQSQLGTMPPNSLSALMGGLALLENLDLRPDLDKLICPSLHLFGSHDALVPPRVANLLPKGRSEIIRRAGHLPFLSQPDIFLNLLNEFLL